MLSKELLSKIKQIHVRTDHLVNDVLAGEYKSSFKGRGIEFEEVREYVPGDDIRTIDWNVSARMGNPFVKQFKEERELTIMLMVDVSSSGVFGTFKQLKNEVAAEIAAIFAFSAIRNNDKVGLIIFSDTIEKYIPPKKGKGHVFRVIKEVLEYKPVKHKTDIGEALDFLNKVTKRKTVCFLISDFITDLPLLENSLRLSKTKHDLISVIIKDPRELSLSPVGILELEDSETGEIILIDTFDLKTRKNFEKESSLELFELRNRFRALNVDLIEINTDKSYIDPIIRFFKIREKRI